MNRREILRLGAGFTGALALNSLRLEILKAELKAEETINLPSASFDKLPPWKGFNLLEKFNGRNYCFREDDFRMIHDLGFNFVRLPMDYRAWIRKQDWRKIDEKVLEEIDEAVRYGEKYGIHVKLNFHRAPGYTVASPGEPKCLWTDKEAQEVCSLHWRTLARRYKGISNDRLSFNPFNEPGKFADAFDQCISVHRLIAGAIREEDPERLIIYDGYEAGPFQELVDLRVAQSARGYLPMEVTHYKASWFSPGRDYLEPVWPMVSGTGMFSSPRKTGISEESKGPMIIHGPFPVKTRLRLLVGTVSNATPLVVVADKKVVYRHNFQPGPGVGEWKESVYQEEWKIYQNIYDRDYIVTIPAGTRIVKIGVTDGDWLTLKEIGLQSEDSTKEVIARLAPKRHRQSVFRFHSDDLEPVSGSERYDADWLKKQLAPWIEIMKKGVGVMVGEFGVLNTVPHDVSLRWMKDQLAAFRECGLGFALWNFRGPFGLLDSERNDVHYENYHGHKLDREMLRVLHGEV